MTESSGAPAGWHPDPTGQFEQRYWDGSQWTEHVHSAGVQSISPLSAAPTQAVQESGQAFGQAVVAEHSQQQPAEAAQQYDQQFQPRAESQTIQVAPDASPTAEQIFVRQQQQAVEQQAAQQVAAQQQAILAEAAQQHAAQQQLEAARQQAAQQYAAEQASQQQAQQQAQPLAAAGQQQQGGQPAQSAAGPPAGWHPDPSGQFEQRYWDGTTWTEHVAHQGQQGVSPIGAARPVQTSSPQQVQRQVQQQAGVTQSIGGGGHLMDEPVLVVNQKAKLIEITQEFAVYDQAGNQLGSVVQVGQSALRKVLRFASNVDQYLTQKFEVRDQHGTVVMSLVRPAKFIKSKVVVSSPTGQEIGTIRQENAIGKIRFAFEAGGQRIGGIQAENWRAWNFSIVDAGGQEVARITKTWEGLAKTMFTTADNYVIQIHHRLPEPLRTLVVASALTVDTALKQDARGIGA